jgi:hypothetical protein
MTVLLIILSVLFGGIFMFIVFGPTLRDLYYKSSHFAEFSSSGIPNRGGKKR